MKDDVENNIVEDIIRDAESKDFSFDSQLPVPKVVRESDF